jgi:hypothetical protein
MDVGDRSTRASQARPSQRERKRRRWAKGRGRKDNQRMQFLPRRVLEIAFSVGRWAIDPRGSVLA